MTESAEPFLSATARRLAGSGARVIVCDADADRLQGVMDAGTSGMAISTFTVDLAVGSEVDRLMDLVAADFGQLDLLVQGPALPAGIPWPGEADDDPMSVATPGLKRWTNCVKAAVPLLARSSGRIVSVVASAARYRTSYFRPQEAILSSTPEALAGGAILGLVRQLALELAPKGIRVNAVVVGLIEGSGEFEQMSARERQFVLEEISLGRLGTPEEVAAVIAFLASNASNYLTGAAIDVNGGWWMS